MPCHSDMLTSKVTDHDTDGEEVCPIDLQASLPQLMGFKNQTGKIEK